MPNNKKTPSDVSKMIKDHEVKLVDFKFTDLPGAWQHFTTTLTEYNEDIFTEGLGFDGSSIRGWKVINASDMLVIPIRRRLGSIFSMPSRRSASSAQSSSRSRASLTTAIRAGSRKKRKLICRAPALPTPRSSGRRRNFSSSTTCVSITPGTAAPTRSTAPEGHWNSGREEFPNLGYKIRYERRLFPGGPGRHVAGHPQRNVPRA